ncbi:MAG: glycoside hydrolase family 18 protein [Pirellulales bacterium]
MFCFRSLKKVRRTILVGLALLATMGLESTAWAVDLIGYLPYYRMNGSYNSNMLPAQLPLLDEIRYFGLTINSSGAISTLDGASLASHTSRIAAIKQAIDALPAADRPRLDITLGGAGEAAAYATVAASSTLRTTLAQNVDSLLDQTGATSVDFDWEHPSNATQRSNYGLMVQRVKQEVGSERRVYATMTPEIFMPASAFQGANAIDGVSLMTYDLGWWGNDPGNPLQGEHSVQAYVEDSVEAWTEPPGSPNDRPWVFGSWGNNVAAANLGVGLPFYGRGVTSGNAYTYAEMVAGGTTSDGNYYNYQGQNVWIPGLSAVDERVQYAHDKGLKNIIIWEIGQDLDPSNANSMLRRAYEKNQSLMPVQVPGDYDGNGSVGAEDYEVWRAAFGATSGDMRADGNEDGVIDSGDYTFWRDRMVEVGGAAASVPEPASAVGMILVGVVAILSHRNRGK